MSSHYTLIPKLEEAGKPGDNPVETWGLICKGLRLNALVPPCEPGKLELALEVTEFCHILEGHWILTSESGQVTEVKAGDSFVFPNGWKGTAEVKEKLRKVYMMIL